MSLFDILQQVVKNSGAFDAEHADRHFDDVVNGAPADVFQQGVAEALRSDQTPPFGDLAAQMFGNASPQDRASMLNQILASLGPAVLGGLAGAAGGGALDRLRSGGGGSGGGFGDGGSIFGGNSPQGAGGSPFGGAPQGGLDGLGGLGAILGGLSQIFGGQSGGAGRAAGPGAGLPDVLGQIFGGGQPAVTPEQAQQMPPEVFGRIATEAQQRDPSIIDSLSEFYTKHPELVKTLGGAVLAIAMAKIHERLRS